MITHFHHFVNSFFKKISDFLVGIENGGYNSTIELCIKLCRELGVTLNDIF